MDQMKMDGFEEKDMKKDIHRKQDMDLLEDRPLLSKRRTVVYWKVVAGVVVLHRQPLPSTWVVLPRNLPSLLPHPTLQYPSLPPNHISLTLCFTVLPHPTALGRNPTNPSS